MPARRHTNPQACLCDTGCVCVCVSMCVCARGRQKNSRFHSPLPTAQLDCYAAYDEDAKQTLSKSFVLLRTQTYLPDQTGDLPRRTLNRAAGCARVIQKQNENKTKHFSRQFPRPNLSVILSFALKSRTGVPQRLAVNRTRKRKK